MRFCYDLLLFSNVCSLTFHNFNKLLFFKMIFGYALNEMYIRTDMCYGLMSCSKWIQQEVYSTWQPNWIWQGNYIPGTLLSSSRNEWIDVETLWKTEIRIIYVECILQILRNNIFNQSGKIRQYYWKCRLEKRRKMWASQWKPILHWCLKVYSNFILWLVNSNCEDVTNRLEKVQHNDLS